MSVATIYSFFNSAEWFVLIAPVLFMLGFGLLVARRVWVGGVLLASSILWGFFNIFEPGGISKGFLIPIIIAAGVYAAGYFLRRVRYAWIGVILTAVSALSIFLLSNLPSGSEYGGLGALFILFSIPVGIAGLFFLLGIGVRSLVEMKKENPWRIPTYIVTWIVVLAAENYILSWFESLPW